MPKAPRICPAAGCTTLIRNTPRCKEHTTPGWSQGRTIGQGSPTGWRKTRQRVLERDRYVCQLQYDGCTRHATIADHIASIASLGMSRRDAVNPDQCQAVCAHCHRVKTQREAAAALHPSRNTFPQVRGT